MTSSFYNSKTRTAGQSNLMHFSQRVTYMLSGLAGRFTQHGSCPACGDCGGSTVDRKWFHTLIECPTCMLLYRFPVESPQAMADFYDVGYSEPQAIDLPDDKTLNEMLETGFKGSDKDFTYHSSILSALKVPANGRILDFGANWGYASWQFSRAGFDVESFEISKPRAAFGKKLGLKIHTDINEVAQAFDAVYSCHVLEHTPNPRDVLLKQLSLVKPGGLVAAHTPNGSKDFRVNNTGFHRMWGQAHPVLLSDCFVQSVAGSLPYIVTSDDRPEKLVDWDGVSQVKQPTDGAGLFFAIGASRGVP
jgi:SAM-dependent methyltransferase